MNQYVQDHHSIWENNVSRLNDKGLKTSTISDVSLENTLQLGYADELNPKVDIYVITLNVSGKEYAVMHATGQYEDPQWVINGDIYDTNEYKNNVTLSGEDLGVGLGITSLQKEHLEDSLHDFLYKLIEIKEKEEKNEKKKMYMGKTFKIDSVKFENNEVIFVTEDGDEFKKVN